MTGNRSTDDHTKLLRFISNKSGRLGNPNGIESISPGLAARPRTTLGQVAK